ncbi:MAG TPA: carboxypeptidase regulatory-like domain-containing protein [Thermoanaerobaculia bacterium]|jgi:hypothetical protein
MGVILALGGSAPLFARTNVVPVKVVVESQGKPVEGAYVALVPPERPWSRPAAEKIAEGASVILEVPEGEYRVLAGARGKGMKASETLHVLASAKNEVRVALPGLRPVSGTVRDEAGRPLAGVTIGEVNGFVEAPLGRASELAARHLGADWSVQSAADGTWSLPLPADTKNPIVAEAAGFATTWHVRPEGESEPVALVMKRGAALRATFDREAPDLAVTLTAKGETDAVPPAWQAQFRARRVSKTTLEWPSLAPGEYDLHVQQWDPRTFSPAVKLGTVSLESGAAAEVRHALPHPKPAPKSVGMVLVRPMPQFDPSTIETFGRDGRGGPRSVPRVAERVSGGTLLYLDTTGVTEPFFGTTKDHRFVVLPVNADGRVAEATVMDGGGASLLVKTAGDSALPFAGTATFHQCPRKVAVPVAVGKGGRVELPAPAGCMNFVLDFEPYSPLVFTRQLPMGDPAWLGEFTLYASGRAAVHVVTGEGAGVAGATVSVSAQTAGGGHGSVAVAEQQTGPDGWARFDRLPAGRALAVSARTADGDQSVVENILPDPTREAILDPLRVPKAATLVVKPKLDPDFVAQFPGGHILFLMLEPIDGDGERRTQPAEGVERVEFTRLVPGRWQLGAMVSAGRGSQPVFGEQLDLEPGETLEVDAAFEPLVFRGRVVGKSDDLTGNIAILGSRRSDVVPSVPVASTGEFVAILPRRDTYLVGFMPRAVPQMVWVGNTPFADPSQPVEVRLPQGVIVARLRQNGRPLAGATVMARLQDQPDSTVTAFPVKSGADGQARFEGLLAGRWVVSVLGAGHAQKSVTVSPGEPAHADLEVTDGLAVSGMVSDTFGSPVAGARVACLLPGPDRLPYVRTATTGDDGSFAIEDRAGGRATVPCSVTSFHGAQGYRVVAGEPARLVVPSNPAALHVSSLPAIDRFSSLWLVSRDGRLIDVSSYSSRTPGPVTLTIPALAPDAWKLVRVSSPGDWMALASGGGPLPGIADVTLEPNERKTVDLKTTGRNVAAVGK